MDVNNYLTEFFYQCERCNYKTNILNDMKRHIEKKFICKIKNANFNLTEEEFKIKTLQKKYKIDKEELKKIIENNNKHEKDNKDKDENDKKCKYCNYIFINKYQNKRHEKVCKVKNYVFGENDITLITNTIQENKIMYGNECIYQHDTTNNNKITINNTIHNTTNNINNNINIENKIIYT